MDFSYPFPAIYSSARKSASETCRAISTRPWRVWRILDRRDLYSLKTSRGIIESHPFAKVERKTQLLREDRVPGAGRIFYPPTKKTNFS
jgi:hypothetical protein